MNNKVGMEIVFDRTHLGKVIAEPTEGFYKNTYLVLLSEEGIKLKEGWRLRPSGIDTERKKLCGKYGNNPNNRFYFFSKYYTYQFFGGINKVLANE